MDASAPQGSNHWTRFTRVRIKSEGEHWLKYADIYPRRFYAVFLSIHNVHT